MKITLTDGRVITVPDGTSDATIEQIVRAAQGQSPTLPPGPPLAPPIIQQAAEARRRKALTEAGFGETAADVGKVGLSRLGAGVLDIGGMPGDVEQTGRDIYGAVATGWRDLGKPDYIQRSEVPVEGGESFLPTSQRVKKAVGFAPYQPTTDVGHVVDRTLGPAIELAPPMALGSAISAWTTGAPVGQAVRSGLTQGALKPGLAMGATGLVGDALALPEGFKTAAEMTAGLLAARPGAALPRRVPRYSIEHWERVYDNADRTLRNLGIQITPKTTSMIAQRVLDATLGDPSFDEVLSPLSYRIAGQVVDRVGQTQTIDQLRALHRRAMEAWKSTTNATDRLYLTRIAESLDDAIYNLTPGDVWAPNPAATRQVGPLVQTMREAWRRAKNAERIENVVNFSEEAAPNRFNVAGFQRKLSQQFENWKWTTRGGQRQLSRNYLLLDPPERAMVDKIISGAPSGLRWLMRFNLRGPMAIALAAALGGGTGGVVANALGLSPYAGGAVGGLALPIAGQGAAQGVDLLAAARANKLYSGALGGRRWTWQPDPVALFAAPYLGVEEHAQPELFGYSNNDLATAMGR